MITKIGKSLKILLMIALIFMTLGTLSYAAEETKVTGLKVSQMDRERITLQWDGIRNIAGYEVYINMDNSEYEYLGDARTNTITLVGVQAGKMYGIKVRAYTSFRGIRTYLTEFSDELKVSIPALGMEEQSKELGKVMNIKVDIDEESARASLNWDTVTNAMGYEVWINAAGNGYVYLGSCVNNSVSVTNFTRGIEYMIKIRAFKTEKGVKVYSKEYSEEIKIFIEAKEEEIPIPGSPDEEDQDHSNPTKLDKVTGLTVSMNKNIATFNWDKMPGALGYEISITTPAYSNLSRITATNTLKVSGFNDAGFTYKAKVRAYKLDAKNNKLYGDYSDEVTFSCEEEKITTPNKVTGLTVSMNKDVATFYWNKVNNALGYQICITVPFVGDVTRFVTINAATVAGFTETQRDYKARVRAYTLKNTGEKVYGDFSEEITFRYQETIKKPAQVTGVTVKVSESNATISWNKVSDAFGYEIVVDKSISSGNIDVKNVTSYTIKNLSYKEEGYTVRVVAYKLNDKSQRVYGDYSNEVTFNIPKPYDNPTNPTNPSVTKPAKVSGFSISVSGNNVTFKWNAVSGAAGYELYETGGYYKIGNITSITNEGYTYKESGYKAKIRAYKMDGSKKVYGDWSDEKSFNVAKPDQVTKPGKVTGLQESMSSNTVTLKWAAVSGAAGYEVSYSKMQSSTIPVSTATKVVTGTSCTINELVVNTHGYTAKVRAYKMDGNQKVYGDYSSTITFSVIQAVTGVKVTSVTSSYITVTWNKIGGVNGYEVYVVDPDGRGKTYTTSNVNIKTISKVLYLSNKNYTVSVRAYKNNSSGGKDFGIYSSKVSVKGIVPKQVTGLKQIADSPRGSHRISWNKVEGNNIGYEVCAEDAKGIIVMNSFISGNQEVISARSAHTVKVRAYISENGKTTYGAWSTILTLK